MRVIVTMVLLVVSVKTSYAQDTKEYTDEELSKHANVMVWAEQEKARMTEVYNRWINSNEDLGAPKFLKIKKAKGDSLQLAEMGITAIEVAAFKSILANYDSMTNSFVEVYKGKIKEEIGAGLYNALKGDLKSDAALRSRYDQIFDALMEGTKEEESE